MKLSLQSPQSDRVATVAVEDDLLGVRTTPFSDPITDLLGSGFNGGRISLNLRSAIAIDSSGINWLIDLHQRCRNSGGRLVLHSLSPTIAKVFRILRLDKFFQIAEDRLQADTLLNKAG